MANICSVSVRVISDNKQYLDSFLNSLTDEIIDEDYTERETDTMVYLGANTTWRAPIEYFLSLSSQFPCLLFYLKANEPGLGYNQSAIFEDGIMIDMTNYDTQLIKMYCLDNISRNKPKSVQKQYTQLLNDVFEKGLYDIMDDYNTNYNSIFDLIENLISFKRECLGRIQSLEIEDDDKKRYSEMLDRAIKENLLNLDFDDIVDNDESNWDLVKEELGIPEDM